MQSSIWKCIYKKYAFLSVLGIGNRCILMIYINMYIYTLPLTISLWLNLNIEHLLLMRNFTYNKIAF